jgi:SAM-dependent methyltransferase
MSAISAELQRTFSGSIPEYYDKFLGRAWFDAIGADLAARLPRDPGGDVLEIACGTGLVTRRFRERLDPARRLVASDLSKPMLEYARTSLSGVDGIDWREADAAKLPFAGGEFAAAVCSLGVMFVPAREALFSEVRRVLEPGGDFIFNVWDRIEEQTCARVFGEVIETLFPGDQEIHFRVPYDMHDENALRKLLAGAGFETPLIERVPLAVEGVSPRDIATGLVRGTPRGLLIEKRGVRFEDVIDKVTDALEREGGKEGAFRGKCSVIAIEARAAR